MRLAYISPILFINIVRPHYYFENYDYIVSVTIMDMMAEKALAKNSKIQNFGLECTVKRKEETKDDTVHK